MSDIDAIEAGIKARRFVRGRCTACGAPSPVRDQQEDPRRSSVAVWMERHRREAHPVGVVWELAGGIGSETGPVAGGDESMSKENE